MSNTSCTLRTRKFMTNRLLARRQFVSARIPEGILRTAPAAAMPVFFATPLYPETPRLRRHAEDVHARSGDTDRTPPPRPLPSQILDVLHPGRANVPKVRTPLHPCF